MMAPLTCGTRSRCSYCYCIRPISLDTILLKPDTNPESFNTFIFCFLVFPD